VHVDFAPVADVNNNPRNPVINIRSFGENPARAGEMVASFARGLQDAGMLAVLKHFPGHGDTDVDSHLGLPIVAHGRERLDAVELAPFKAGIAAGASGVMVGHIELPSIDPEKQPATFSPKIISTLLKPGFDGLIYSDSMKMAAITKMATAGEAAVRAVKAGIDVILDSPDSAAAAAGIVAAVKAGDIPRSQVEQSARRILEAKGAPGSLRTRMVNLDAVPLSVGGRKHDAVARSVSERSITLVKDARNSVPLPTPKTGRLLYLSVLDYPSGWRVAAPSRAVIPELKARWANTESVEISDRTTPSSSSWCGRWPQLRRDRRRRVRRGVVRQRPPRSCAAGRATAAGSGARHGASIAAVRGSVFRQSLHADVRPEIPSMMLTYDFSDYAETSAVKALAGEIAIGGKLPIALPGLFPIGHGLTPFDSINVTT
jgi:beta-N-acetylhexosaminidase